MELKEALKKRITVRDYNEDKQITEEQLKYILFAGMSAPISRKDYSSIKITVVQEKKLLQELSDPFGEGEKLIYNVPTVIVISTKKSAFENIECFNVACMVENMLLAATDLDLGSIYLTSFLRKAGNNSDIFQKLEVIEGYKPISAVGVGYNKIKTKVEEVEVIEGRIEVFRK